jgi:hypothetical protein
MKLNNFFLVKSLLPQLFILMITKDAELFKQLFYGIDTEPEPERDPDPEPVTCQKSEPNRKK